MYCYYPLDETWPARARNAFKDKEIAFQWDYPYDDYFTYKGGIGGTTDDEPFTCMRDVRRHGQDVILTMTIDPNVTDEHLEQIGKELSTFSVSAVWSIPKRAEKSRWRRNLPTL